MRFRALIIVALATSAAVAASASAHVEKAPARTVAAYLTPSTLSTDCRLDARRRAACRTVGGFFRAVNSRQFESACSLLGERLRSDTYGFTCPRFLALGSPEAMPWGILGARRAGAGVSILVTLGQSELGRTRLRQHRAFVALENGHTRILATRLVD
jgi:hypothetical protein